MYEIQPDEYFTTKVLPNLPTQEGQYQPAKTFTQGNDILFPMYITYNSSPIEDRDWKLEVFIKEHLSDDKVCVYGTMTQGLFKSGKVGNYTFHVPAISSAKLKPGVYTITVKGTQRLGTGSIAGLTVDLFNGKFNVDLTASSPYPNII